MKKLVMVFALVVVGGSASTVLAKSTPAEEKMAQDYTKWGNIAKNSSPRNSMNKDNLSMIELCHLYKYISKKDQSPLKDYIKALSKGDKKTLLEGFRDYIDALNKKKEVEYISGLTAQIKTAVQGYNANASCLK